MKTSTLRRAFSLGLFALALGACDNDPSGPEPVDSVDIFPLSATVIVGGKQQLTATVTDEDGAELTGREITWSSSNTAIATVSATGEVTAVAVGGPVAITATVEGETGIAQVTVLPVPVDRVELSPNPAEVRVGLTTQLALVARDAAGNALTGRNVTMVSSNTAVATVTNAGVVTGVSAGSAVITASVEGRIATTMVTVTPGPVATVQVEIDNATLREGATRQLTVTLRDASTAQVSRPVTYSTSNPAVATVSATGVVTAVAAGTATITATSEAKTGSVMVTVLPAQLTSVQLIGVPTSVLVGDTARVGVILRDSLGRTLPGRPVVYTSSNPAIATISSTGYVDYVGAGNVSFTATVEGKSDTRGTSSSDYRLTFQRSGQACREIVVGQSCTISATLRFTAVDNPASSTPEVTFTGGDPNIATLTNNGPNTAVVTGVSPGVMNFGVTYVAPNGTTTRSTGGQVTVQPAP